MSKPESYRNKWALGLTVICSVLVFVAFGFYRGFFSLNSMGQSQSQTAAAISAQAVPSPWQNTSTTFSNAFKKIDQQYQELKNSIFNVLVPFVSSIEVYERN